MKVTIHSKDQVQMTTKKVKKMVPVTTMQEVEEEVTEMAPKAMGDIKVFPVQYRNYDATIHIQHKGEHVNRYYGFAFDIDGQCAEDNERLLPSLAGTDAKYFYGSLVLNGTQGWLIGQQEQQYAVSLAQVPLAIRT